MMALRPEAVAAFLDRGPAVLVRVEVAKGSTPRDAGAWMLVSRDGLIGTIGGGQLEYIATDAARRLMAEGGAGRVLDVPLGPEIGQCCGGRTRMSLALAEGETRARLLARVEADRRALPEVYVLGAGHVGRALAAALKLLPVRAVLVDSREEELSMAPEGVEARLTPLPEEMVRRGGAGGGVRGADPRARARFPDRARGAGAGGRGLCGNDRLADQAGVVPALAAGGG